MRVKVRTLAMVGACLLVGASGASAAERMNTVGFPGANNVQTWVALDKGFFAKQGVEVNFSTTKGSVAEITDLLAGKYQAMTTDFDNIVADAEGQGEKSFPDAKDLVAIMGVHSGLESLVSTPDVKTFADLKGKTAVVDAAKSGYALVMYKLLEKHGLKPGDYKVKSVGGTPFRRKALESGEAQAAMLSPPIDVQLQAKGYHILAKSSDLGAQQGSVYVVRRSWAKAHPKEVDGYVRAIVAATKYIFAHKAGTIDVLKKHVPKLTDKRAQALYAELTGPNGLDRGAKINIKGVKNILAIREEFGTPKKKLGPPEKYIDESIYDRATAKR